MKPHAHGKDVETKPHLLEKAGYGVVFIEDKNFTREVVHLLTAKEYQQLQETLIKNPESGKLMPGTNSFRKLRLKSENKGQKSGMRIVYHWCQNKRKITFLDIYSKSDEENPSRFKLPSFCRAKALENSLIIDINLPAATRKRASQSQQGR